MTLLTYTSPAHRYSACMNGRLSSVPIKMGGKIMASYKKTKIALLAVFSVLVFAWAVSGTYSTVLYGTSDEGVEPQQPAAGSPDDYVGSETCKACHEDQFKNFASTKHAKLKEVASLEGQGRRVRIVPRSGQSASGRRDR